MALLTVTKLGNPVLRMKTRAVPEAEITTKKFRTFLDDMVETMRAENGVGLAGPQVDFAGQVFVVDALPTEDDPEGKRAAT